MMKARYAAVLPAILLCAACGAAAQPKSPPIALAAGGVPQAAVILAARPTRPAQVAAREFLHYVRKMTGAELPVRSDADPAEGLPRYRVLIGESAATRALGLRNADFAEQEYLVETRGEALVLMGRDAEEYGEISYEKNGAWPVARGERHPCFTPAGSLYAVHTFLEKACGVRWYMPGDLGEVCPARRDLAVGTISLRTKPWTRYRWSSRQSWRDPFKFYGWKEPDQLVHMSGRDAMLWMLRMKMGGGQYACNHAFSRYFERFGKERPEWWKDGAPSSRWPHPDYANPDLVRQAAADAIEYFSTGTAQPGAMAAGDYFAIMPNDGRGGLIWSEAGEKLRDNDPAVQPGFSCGWASDFVFSMVNTAARTVREKFPDKWITCCAYGPYFMPPRRIGPLEPNISIQQAGFITRSFDPKEWEFNAGNLKALAAMTKQLYVWEYYLHQAETRFRSFPVVYPRHIARSMALLRETGVKGMFFEASAAPAQKGPYSDATIANPAEDLLNHYFTWKYLCEGNGDIEADLAEFFRLFYGPAEKPMKEFFSLLESRWSVRGTAETAPAARRYWETMYTAAVNDALARSVAQAQTLAKEEPYRSRVDLVRTAIFERAERNWMEHRSQYAARRRIRCAPAAVPALDGRLDDAAWSAARVSESLVSVENRPAAVATTFRVLRDDANLYVAVSCPEPNAAKIAAACRTADDAAIGKDDRVEILIDAGRTRERYKRIAVNAAGTVLDAAVEGAKSDLKWSSGASAAAVVGKSGWTAEIRVPLAALTEKPLSVGDVWGINVVRFRTTVDPAGREPATTVWAPTFGDLNSPTEFGIVEFRPGTAPPVSEPVVRYDFEDDFVAAGRVSDRAGVETGAVRLFSPARLSVMKDGERWTSAAVVDGIAGRGIFFGGDAAKRYLQVDLARAVNISDDDFTVAFWFKAAAPGGVFLGSTTSPPYWQIGLRDIGGKAQPALAINAGGGKQTSLGLFPDAAAALGDGAWHHYAFAVDRGRNVRLYVDGAFAGATAISNHTGPLKQVLSVGGPYGHPTGAMDEFCVLQGAFDADAAERLFRERGGKR